MRTLFLSILLITLKLTGSAQSEKINGGAGHLHFGYSNFNMDAMNNRLPNKYPTISNNFKSAGGSGYTIIKDIIIGAEGYASIGCTLTKGPNTISPTLGVGMLNMGYIMFSKNHFIVYPLLGFGGSATTFKFKEVQGPNEMNTKVNDKESSLSYSNMMLSFSFGAEKIIAPGKDDCGISVALRMGVVYALPNNSWKRNDTEVNGLNSDVSGFYFSIGIGRGGWSTK